jgi:hypothetical protein
VAANGWLAMAGEGCGNHYVLLTTEPPAGFVGAVADPDHLDYLVASNLWRQTDPTWTAVHGNAGCAASPPSGHENASLALRSVWRR